MSHTLTPSVRATSLALLLSLLFPLASATELVRPRPLMEYADIQLAQELDTALVTLNDKVSQCAGNNEENPSACLCRFQSEADATQASYEKVLQARPKWKDKILYWKNPENMSSHNLVMPAIEHQLKSSHACNSLPAPAPR